MTEDLKTISDWLEIRIKKARQNLLDSSATAPGSVGAAYDDGYLDALNDVQAQISFPA